MTDEQKMHPAADMAEIAQLNTTTTRKFAAQDRAHAAQWEQFNSFHWHDKMDLEARYEPAYDMERRLFFDKYGEQRRDTVNNIQELEDKIDRGEADEIDHKQLKAYERHISHLDGYLNRRLDDHKTHHANAEAQRQSKEYERAEYVRQEQEFAVRERREEQLRVAEQKRENTPTANDNSKPLQQIPNHLHGLMAWQQFDAAADQDNQKVPEMGQDFDQERYTGADLGQDFTTSHNTEHEPEQEQELAAPEHELTPEERAEAYIQQEMDYAEHVETTDHSAPGHSHTEGHKR